MRRGLTDLATLLLVAAAVSLSVVIIRREFYSPQAPNLMARVSTEKNWQRYAAVGHVLGPEAASVKIVEFPDFECPFCQRFVAYIDSLRVLGIGVRVVYRHFPSRSHRFALPAIRTSECAAREAGFEAIHHTLYAYSDSFGVRPWWWFANLAGVRDSTRFHECLLRESEIPALARDTVDAKLLEVRGTPTLLIEDLRYNGLPSFDSLKAYVERAGRL